MGEERENETLESERGDKFGLSSMGRDGSGGVLTK